MGEFPYSSGQKIHRSDAFRFSNHIKLKSPTWLLPSTVSSPVRAADRYSFSTLFVTQPLLPLTAFCCSMSV